MWRTVAVVGLGVGCAVPAVSGVLWTVQGLVNHERKSQRLLSFGGCSSGSASDGALGRAAMEVDRFLLDVAQLQRLPWVYKPLLMAMLGTSAPDVRLRQLWVHGLRRKGALQMSLGHLALAEITFNKAMSAIIEGVDVEDVEDVERLQPRRPLAPFHGRSFSSDVRRAMAAHERVEFKAASAFGSGESVSVADLRARSRCAMALFVRGLGAVVASGRMEVVSDKGLVLLSELRACGGNDASVVRVVSEVLDSDDDNVLSSWASSLRAFATAVGCDALSCVSEQTVAAPAQSDGIWVQSRLARARAVVRETRKARYDVVFMLACGGTMGQLHPKALHGALLRLACGEEEIPQACKLLAQQAPGAHGSQADLCLALGMGLALLVERGLGANVGNGVRRQLTASAEWYLSRAACEDDDPSNTALYARVWLGRMKASESEGRALLTTTSADLDSPFTFLSSRPLDVLVASIADLAMVRELKTTEARDICMWRVSNRTAAFPECEPALAELSHAMAQAHLDVEAPAAPSQEQLLTEDEARDVLAACHRTLCVSEAETEDGRHKQ